MRQAITTRYLCPTNHRGGRIIARYDAKWAIIPWDHSLNTEENHRQAALELARRLGWFSGSRVEDCWTGGELPGRAGYCWVWHEARKGGV